MKSSWRQRHANMTPLFSNTMATQMDTGSAEDSVDGQIQATLDIQQFTQTQDGRYMYFISVAILTLFTL